MANGDVRYIHERSDWPRFQWRAEELAGPLAAVRHRQGRLLGRLEALGFPLRAEATLAILTQDVVTSSTIEGESLDREQVRSSVARRLGIDVGSLAPVDRGVEGVVEMILDATQRFDAPLTEERLFDWHAALFPTGRSGMARIRVGAWRGANSGPMQVVSGPIGCERVHFQAPAASRVAEEMAAFLTSFNDDDGVDPVIRAGLAHLWFVTLHPFDDGNGRIARAIADMALARAEGTPLRFYSMSGEIRKERAAYYRILEKAQKGQMDVTGWLLWFLACLGRAVDGAEETLAPVLRKARFWEDHADLPMNERQRLVVNRLLDGFEGKLTTSKWARITKSSQDTAYRDIVSLVESGVLARDAGGGRSTSYSLIA